MKMEEKFPQGRLSSLNKTDLAIVFRLHESAVLIFCDTVVPNSNSWPLFTKSQLSSLIGVGILQNVYMFIL